MHVGILASPSRGAEVKAVMRILKRHGIETKGASVSSSWAEYSGDPLSRVLERSTHVFVLPDGQSLPDWAIYVLGYAAGRAVQAAIVGSPRIPPGLGAAQHVETRDVESYVLAARSSWERRHRVELARARLGGREADPGDFYRAALDADRQRVEDFLAAGQAADARTPEGVPVLVGAVRGRSVEVVQVLLGSGADPNCVCGTDGSSALCEAASLGLETILGVLLVHGADPNQVTANGQTALMLATSQGHGDIVRRLMSAGADPSRRDSLDMTAADYARLFGKNEILESLEVVNRS